MNDRERNDVITELARAIAALANGDEDGARVTITALARVWEPPQQALPGMPAPAPRSAITGRKEAAMRLVQYWRERCPGRQQAKPTPERITKLMARLTEGYTEAELRKAIDGAAHAANVNKETGERYDDVTLICRSGVHLESFIARGVTATGEIAEVVAAGGPVEDRIAAKRREMAVLRRDGRATEYEAAVRDLETMMRERKAS